MLNFLPFTYYYYLCLNFKKISLEITLLSNVNCILNIHPGVMCLQLNWLSLNFVSENWSELRYLIFHTNFLKAIL